MNSADLLRQKRDMGYGTGPSEKGEAMDERCFPLTEEENGMLQDGMPAQAMGQIRDGKFYAELVKPMSGSGDRPTDGPMDVRPPTQMSPS